jgi:hypothetical protein
MRTAMKLLIGGVAVAAVTWTSTYMYWHIRVLRALRTLETQTASSDIQTATDVLNEAGCRALPYLVRSLNPSRDTGFLAIATTTIAAMTAAPGEPFLYNPKVAKRMAEWRIEPEDAPAVRQGKCDLIRAWWGENGSRHHQIWRVWSRECLP